MARGSSHTLNFESYKEKSAGDKKQSSKSTEVDVQNSGDIEIKQRKESTY